MTMRPSSTRTSYVGTASSAGPRVGAPVAQRKRAPCQAPTRFPARLHPWLATGRTPADSGIASCEH